jgi:diguanylate cyclase (GGDEF)-like protein/PAS domain S-box-containing protein
MKTILLIEDNPGDARLMREMFREREAGLTELTLATDMAGGEQHIGQKSFDIILLDLGLPDAQGLEAVRRALRAAPRTPLVVLSGLEDEALALQTLQEGAQDYLIKGQIETRALMRALRYAIERKIMDDAVFAEKEHAQVTLNSIGDAVISSDVSGTITFINIVAERMTGWPRQDAVGRPVGEIFLTRSSNARLAAAESPESEVLLNLAILQHSESILVTRDGAELLIEDCSSPIHTRAGEVAGTVIVFRDVTAARALDVQIAHSAQHDFLTGLPNRMLLNDRITQAIALARRHDKQVAVLFLDLDGFKHINDSLGHSTGDKLLQSIASRLKACVPDPDTVSRQGGDEFVVLLSELESLEEAGATARQMLNAVAEAHSVDRHDLHITTSIGVSIYPDDGLDAETLIKNADTAMYQAKENGRQGYQFFKPAMNVRAVERQSLEENLRRALQRDELALYYQPKVCLATGTITGAEALLRWTHPTRGPVSPAQFIPVAEDCGLILPIGEWVLREACRQARAWTDAGLPPASIAVNVSAVQFRSEGFVEGLFAILAETGLDPQFLELELTEGVLMTRAESSVSILETLRGRGIRVSVDDFGTGYSSLSYIHKFPLDTLKIDQSFIRRIGSPISDASIVTAVIGMARNLKLRVIAEGVETREELDFLRMHNCDEVQGYYFSRPVQSQAYAKLLEFGLQNSVTPPLNADLVNSPVLLTL